MTSAESTKVRWMITYQNNLSFSVVGMFMKTRRRWIDEIATIEAATLFFNEPRELVLRLLDVKRRDEVFVAREHHHDDEAAHEAHVDHGKNAEYEVGLLHFQNMRNDVEGFLKEFDAQTQKREREAEIDRSEQPAARIHGSFEKRFHRE